MTDGLKMYLKVQLANACNGYVNELLNMWDISQKECYWVNGPGLLLCLGDYFLDLEELVYCVENEVKYDDFTEWHDYCIECRLRDFDDMPLKDWCNGAKRIGQETFEKIDSMRKELEDLVDEVKKKQQKDKICEK